MGIFCDSFQQVFYQLHHNIRIDPVLCRAECSNRNFTICRTGILRDPFPIIYPVYIHFRTAISTIHQPCQWMCFSPSIRISADILPNPLDIIKGFLINDCFLRILKYCPVIFGHIMAFFVLKMLSGLKINRVAKIFPLFQDPCHRRRTPRIGVFDLVHSSLP